MSAATSGRVLVVDDTPANLSLLLDALSEAGFDVRVAESGRSALTLLEHTTPDLILLDLVMPGMDGVATCHAIKQRPACNDVPILFMTAVEEPAQKLRAFEAGAVDYITKPVHPPEVMARVRAQVELRAARAGLQRKNEELEAEVALRLDAEAQLAQSLDRALLVVDREHRIVFGTLRASDLLHKHVPTHVAGVLPMELRHGDRFTGAAGTLLVRRFTAADDDPLSVLVLVEEQAPPGPADLVQLGLTPRQAEVLYWVAQGKTNGETGVILGASARTIDKHMEQILARLGLENRFAATNRANEILRPTA
jgi:DNA-binding response OmpR family regulator/DNA-binding CsgD family transcriptional regulator